MAFSSKRRGFPHLLWGHKFLEEKWKDHKIFDNQNVGSHKLTIDRVFILFEKTDFDTSKAFAGRNIVSIFEKYTIAGCQYMSPSSS